MTTKSLKVCLTEARALLARKGGWGKGANARDAKGAMVPVNDPTAVKFCMIGSVYRVCPELTTPAIKLLQICVHKQRGGKDESISGWNDKEHRKLAQVLKVMDCAIAEASKE